MTAHPRLLSVATAAPPNILWQKDAERFARHLFSDVIATDPRLALVFEHAEIEKRHLCVPLEWLGKDHDFAEKNALYMEHALSLGADVARKALAEARLPPDSVDHLVFVSSTGLAAPSIDARLANVLELRDDVRRTPIWGLGCAGGAVGLSRARDFALADPRSRVLLIALELCSLTFQRNDLSKKNLVAVSLFADGAAAAVVSGVESVVPRHGENPPLELQGSRSTLWKDTLDVMGWDIDGDGLHVVFSRDIPTIVHEKVKPSLDAFLDSVGLDKSHLDHLVAHPGGVKVLAAYANALGLPVEALDHARDVLREYGNMSAPTCLFVLDRFQRAREIAKGDHAVVTALGPGFSAEYVLVGRAA
ncbi:MAG TPA: 3-oxoacyl-[acyl-carrier-protein] synthase III C-terminal domain-containing protein [Candidatus Eisenbacteria bacterium]|nr:3-oxoacyl-[acyl-carrier-protein] synthase III C-terminal domain-containing protein [Candidatus Eisenbacteria bacterium]